MEEIRQEYTLDANQVIKSLRDLNKYTKNYDTSVQRLTASLNKFNNANVTSKMRDIERSTKRVGKSTKQMSESWVMSMETMSRVVVTQAIVRALSSIRNQFERTAQSAIEFQRQAAEISTITPDLGGIGNIQNDVKQFSNLYNTQLSDTGKALYQTISNNVEAVKSLDFMGQAALFAKAGVTSLENAVNLGSGTLNAYGQSADNAGTVFAKFLKTIELGRTTAAELASSFGRAAPIANQLGVSMDELMSSFATVTINGVKTSEATTQIVGAMNALIKPSEEMKEALRKLGFESGESIIKTLGFQGALTKLVETTNGSTTEIAKLIPRVRGLNAALILTGQGSKKYIDTFAQIKNTTAALNKSRALKVIGTDAEKVTSEYNKLANAFSTELGPELLKTNRQLFDLVGGANTLINVGKASIPIIEAGALAIGIWGTKALLAQAAAKGWFGALRSLPGGILAVGAAISAGQSIGNWLSGSSDVLEKLEGDNKKALENFQFMENERLSQAIAVDNERIQAARLANLQVTKDYQSSIARIQASNDQLIANTKNAMTQLIKARKKAVNELSRAAKNSESEIKNSQNRIADLRLSTDDRQFARKIADYNDRQKTFALEKRAKKLSSQATDLMDVGNIEQALKLFNKAISLGDEAENLGGSKVIDKIVNQQIQAEQQLQRTQKTKAVHLREQAELQTEILKTLKQQAETVKNIDVFKPGKYDLPFEVPVKQLQDQLKQAFETFKIKLTFDVSNLESLTGEKYKTPEGVFSGLSKAANNADDLRRQEASNAIAQKQIAQLRSEINQIQTDASGAMREIFRNPGGSSNSVAVLALEQFRTKLKEVSASSNVTNEDLLDLKDQLGRLNEYQQTWTSTLTTPGISKDVLEFSNALNKLIEIKNQQQTIQLVPQDQLSRLQLFLNSLSMAEANARSIANSFERAANASARTMPLTRAFGGVAYRAFGGRGTDTIPAMLSPGEFVVNAKSSRQFYSQLTAINAGVQPSYQQGGTVYHDHSVIGDINVTESKTPQLTAQTIINKINRAQRRGVAKIK